MNVPQKLVTLAEDIKAGKVFMEFFIEDSVDPSDIFISLKLVKDPSKFQNCAVFYEYLDKAVSKHGIYPVFASFKWLTVEELVQLTEMVIGKDNNDTV
jgi:hypothetical protein